MATSKLSLKLLLDKKGQRVMFAEAGKDFVDFLFSLLTLPIGTILSLLDNKDMAGSLPILFKSVSDLDDGYVNSDQKKDVLLKHTAKFPVVAPQVPLLPMIKEWSLPTATLYNCGSSYCGVFSATTTSRCKCGKYMNVPTSNPSATLYKCGSCLDSILSTTCNSYCTSCGRSMTTAVRDYVSKSQGGFLKESVMYLVADDLAVSPMSISTITNFSLLNKFNIKDLDELEEKVVQIGMDEGLQLLRHSLNSKTVLTDVFLGGATTSRKRSKGNGIKKLEDDVVCDDTEDEDE